MVPRAFNKIFARCLIKLLKSKRGISSAEYVFVVGAAVAMAAGVLETFGGELLKFSTLVGSDMLEALDILKDTDSTSP